jgi:transposase
LNQKSYGRRLIDSPQRGFTAGVDCRNVPANKNEGAGMVQVADHLGIADLQAGWRESKDATLARHYQVIWLLAEGRSCAEVARLTGFVRCGVEELVERYNRFGPSSLGDRRRGNGARPRTLTPEVLAMLRERVKTPPDDGGVWTAKRAVAVMAAELGLASVAAQRGWEALRAIGWTIQRPRPQHARAATPEEQEAFKKTSPKPSPRRRRAIPARSSRSSPPTSTGSD